MRKRLIPPTQETVRPDGEGWLDLERAAAVEVTSEEENFPVESALVLEETRGWRAAIPGTQTIRLVFDQPQRLRHIPLVFEETETTRTQEFVLRWSPRVGQERLRSSAEVFDKTVLRRNSQSLCAGHAIGESRPRTRCSRVRLGRMWICHARVHNFRLARHPPACKEIELPRTSCEPHY